MISNSIILQRRVFIRAFIFFVLSITLTAQFKELGPAPFPPAAAHQKIRHSLETVTPDNRKQTIATLSNLASWYRDILDEELIASWKASTRASLPEVIEALADAPVASSVVEFSWRERGKGAFIPAYAPMLGHLMARYSKSAEPFLEDLLGSSASGPRQLSPPEAETLCRILLDMPDLGNWRKDTLQILPAYRQTAEKLLLQDTRGTDQEKADAARIWLLDLKWIAPVTESRRQSRPRNPTPPAPTVAASAPPRMHVDQPLPPVAETKPPQAQAVPPIAPVAPVSRPAPTTHTYAGEKSGVFESTGGPIPGNSEYVFRNVPLVQMKLDFDTKIWDARLAPSENNMQRIIVRNKSASPQKRCIVHWSVVP